MVKKEEIIEKASKGYIKDFYSVGSKLLTLKDGKAVNGLLPDFDRNTALEIIRQDTAVQAAITTLVDKSLENGYEFSNIDGKSNLNAFNDTMKKVRFDRLLRDCFYQIYAYQNCFIEIVRDGNGNVKELHTLETTQTEPVATQHGEVTGYVQVIPNAGAMDYPSWTPDDITHIKINGLTTNIWSDIEIRALYTSTLIKQYIMAYFGWKYGTNQLRPLYSIINANEDSIKDFLAYWKSVQRDITKPLVFDGEITKTMMAEATEESSLLSVLDKMDANIYAVLQVPPIASGETGQSNRSSSDKQDQMLATRIKAVHRVFKESLENDLYPKMGYTKISVVFNPVIKTDITKLLENAERMVNMGFKKDKIEEYLDKEGFIVKGKLFDPNAEAKKSMDMFASRKGKPEDQGNKQIGTGEASTTRQDQLVSKAYPHKNYSYHTKSKFEQYPYVMR